MEYNFRNDAIRLQMSKSKNDIFYIFDFPMVRSVLTKVANRHTYIETDKSMDINEMLQIC